MVKALEHRRSSVLGERDWLSLPWKHRWKDNLQIITDIGFRLAALMEKVDTVPTTPNMESQSLKELQFTCFVLSKDLFAVYENHLQDMELPTSLLDGTLDSPYDWSAIATPFSIVLSLMYFWTFLVLLNDVVDPGTKVQSHTGADVFQCTHAAVCMGCNRDHSTHDQAEPNRCAVDITACVRLSAATRILHMAPYFLQSDMGWFGPARLFFPLTCALKHLEKTGAPQLVTARKLLGQLFAKIRQQ